MNNLIRKCFTPPDVPELRLPGGLQHVPGVRQAIRDAVEFVYYYGVWDGFLVGALLATAGWIIVYRVSGK